MSFDDGLQERVAQSFNSEVPVRAEARGVVARADGAIAWVDAVDVYSSVVCVRTSLIVIPQQAGQVGAQLFSWVRDPADQDDEIGAVETAMTVDGHLFSTSDDTLHSTAVGSSSEGRSHASWWLPHIPTDELVVTVWVPSLSMEGTLTFNTSDWAVTAAGVLSV